MKEIIELRAKVVEQDKFPLGRVIATDDASMIVGINDLLKALVRHGCGDWQKTEREFNERSLRESGPIITDHMTPKGVRYRVFTSANRRQTLIDVRPSYGWPREKSVPTRIGRYKKGEGGIVRF